MILRRFLIKILYISNFPFQVRCVAGREAADEAAEAGDVVRTRARTLSRTYSNLSSSPMDSSMNVAEPSEKVPDLDTIPPLPLHALFAADQDESGARVEQHTQGIFLLRKHQIFLKCLIPFRESIVLPKLLRIS